MMKKVLAQVLSLSLMAFLFAGCTGVEPPKASPDASEAPSQSTASTAPTTPTEKTLDISTRTIRFATTSSEGTAIVDAMHAFADLVNEASGGLITVDLYPSSALGDVSESYQNVQLGVLDMAVTSAQNVAGSGASDFVALSLPYVFKDSKHIIDVIQGEIGDRLLSSVQASGTKCVGIGFWDAGSRCFFTKTPVRSLADIKGMKIRCQQLDVDTEMTKALGASPTPIAFSELYSSLQTGVVDGAENPLSGIYSGKFYEVCKYVTLDEHSAPPVVVVFSETIWNTMSEDEHDIILNAWKEASSTNYDCLVSEQAHYIELLEAEGVEVIQLSDKDDWYAAMEPVYKTYGSDCADILDAIAAIG